MRYYNQTNYPHVPYPTLTDLPELGRVEIQPSEMRAVASALHVWLLRMWQAGILH